MAEGHDPTRPIGKGNPPRANQFKKGEQTANPNGRPRKPKHHPIVERQVYIDFFRASERPVKVGAGRKAVTKTAMQAVYDRLFDNALKGSNPAMHRVIDLRLAMTRAYEAQQMSNLQFVQDVDAYVKRTGDTIHPEVQKIIDDFRRRIERHGDELFDNP